MGNISQSEINQQSQIYKYAKLIILKKKIKKSKQSDHVIKFRWHNSEEGVKILSEVLNLTLSNLHKSVFKDLDNFLIKQKKKILKHFEIF